MMTLRQICNAIREETTLRLPDGRTGVIAEFKDYDWRNYQVTVTTEDSGPETVSQWGDVCPAFPKLESFIADVRAEIFANPGRMKSESLETDRRQPTSTRAS
jgi:hypothetical protein